MIDVLNALDISILPPPLSPYLPLIGKSDCRDKNTKLNVHVWYCAFCMFGLHL